MMPKASFGLLARRVAVAVAGTFLLAGCSDSPEKMIASARSYIERSDYNAATIQLKNALQKDAKNAEGRFLLGWILYDQERYSTAALELRRAVDAGYAPDEAVPLLARALVRDRDYAQALKSLEGVSLGKAEARATVLASLGEAFAATGKRDEARQRYEAALAANPDELLAQIGLVRLAFARDDIATVEKKARDIVARDPGLVEGYMLLSDVLLSQNKLKDAVEVMRTALAERPDSVSMHSAFVSLLLTANDLDGVAKELEQLKRVAPGYPITRYVQAYLDFRANKLDAARTGILEVTKAAPGFLPAQLLAGAVLVQTKEYAQAQTYIDGVLKVMPQHALARTLKATVLMGTGHADRAIDLIQPLLGEAKPSSALLVLAGQAYLAKGDVAQAREYLGRAASAAPDSADARAKLGAVRLMSGEAGAGFADLEAASQLDQNSIQADLIQVFAHMRRNEPEQAMKAFAVIERKWPDDPQTWNIKGSLFQGLGNVAEARSAYEKALTLRPDFLIALVNLARMDLARNDAAAARARFDQWLAKNPNNVEALLAYAGVLQAGNAKADEILAALERAKSAGAGQIGPGLALVRFHLMQRDGSKAKNAAQEVAAAWPNDPRALEALARAQAAAGDITMATNTVSTLAVQMPGSPGPQLLLAELQRNANDIAGAERSLRKALQIKPDDANAQRQLIGLLAGKKDFDGALRQARTMQQQKANAVQGYNLEGGVQVVAGREAEAIAAFRKAYDGGGGADSLVRLHALLVHKGQAADANRLVTDWLRKEPKDTAVRTYLAEAALGQKRYADAARLYQDLLKLVPNNPLILNNLAWASWQAQDPQAQGYVEQALKIAPDHPAMLDTLGMIQIGRGQAQAGIANLERAVKLAPEQLGIRLHLARSYAGLGRKDDARREVTEVLQHARAGTALANEANALLKSL
jgi:putative PEP-CTERM system TPR-repeat lipoprotein